MQNGGTHFEYGAIHLGADASHCRKYFSTLVIRECGTLERDGLRNIALYLVLVLSFSFFFVLRQ